MEKSVNIILGFNFHLPCGVSSGIYETFYQQRIRTLISTLYQFPNIPCVLHFSGNLLSWIERQHSELFMVIDDMMQIKQLELLSGGFYEPLMPLLLPLDRVSQIEMLTTYIRQNFGKRTYGCWMPDISWDQNMVSVLKSCNMQWTFLDESRFNALGLNPLLPCLSEDKGKMITIFPKAKHFSDLLETNGTEECINRILFECGENSQTTFSIFPRNLYSEDPCEHFSENCLNNFFKTISSYTDKIEWTLPGKIIKKIHPNQKAYFVQENVKQFLINTPNANNIYAKSIYVRSMVDMLKGDKVRKRRALEKTCKALVYDLFCENSDSGDQISGVVLSIENPRLRQAAFDSLLTAEIITREIKPVVSSLSNFDFNFDGKLEYIYQGDPLNCFIRGRGACIFELDYMPKTWNYINTLQTEYPKSAFCDILTSADLPLSAYKNITLENSRLCMNEIYEQIEMDRAHGKVKLKCPAKKSENNNHELYGAIEIEKYYHIKKNIIHIEYTFINTKNSKEDFSFIPEINLSFFSTNESSLRINYFNDFTSMQDHGEKHMVNTEKNVLPDIRALNFEDLHNEAIVNLLCSREFDVVFEHEYFSGFYQSSRILPKINLHIEPEMSQKLSFQLAVYY
ncbi:MAG: DUF1926 domain-containing protein [Spirochaetaceae bacterium]|jgi:hypothetical protein|nr:DUF1926 domain-containing protein [Spirochaetaceae bacterium]